MRGGVYLPSMAYVNLTLTLQPAERAIISITCNQSDLEAQRWRYKKNPYLYGILWRWKWIMLLWCWRQPQTFWLQLHRRNRRIWTRTSIKKPLIPGSVSPDPSRSKGEKNCPSPSNRGVYPLLTSGSPKFWHRKRRQRLFCHSQHFATLGIFDCL